MNWKLMFKGEFITAIEFAGKRPMLRIKAVKLEELDDEKTGKKKLKGVVRFEEVDRGWVLGKTNAICLAAMFGDDTDGWAGKRVTLCATEVQFGAEKVLGIRVVGSPDIPRNMQVQVKLPRKKPVFMTMHRTPPGGAAPSGARPQRAPPPEPPPEDDAGRYDGLEEPPEGHVSPTPESIAS